MTAEATFAEREPASERIGRTWRLSARRLAVVGLFAVVAGVVAAAVTSREPTLYASSTTLVVVQEEGGPSESETFIRSMQALLTSEDLGVEVQESTGVDLTPQQIVDEIVVERAPGSGVLTATVSDSDELRSRLIAEAIVPAFTSLVEELVAPETEGGLSTFSVRRWGSGEIITEAQSPPVARNAAIAFGLGLALALAGVFLFQQRRPVLGSAADAAGAFGLPVLGTLPPFRRRRLAWNPADGLEGIREAAVSLGWPDPPARTVVSGPGHDAQRTGFVIALGYSLAADGHDVVLIDADVEHRLLSRALGHRRSDGLCEFLDGSVPLRGVLRRVDGGGPGWVEQIADPDGGSVRVVPAGRSGLRSNAVLAGNDVDKLLRRLSERALVVVDAPDIPGPVPSGGLLRAADAIVVVANQGETSVPDAAAAGATVSSVTDGLGSVVLLAADRLRVGVVAEPD